MITKFTDSIDEKDLGRSPYWLVSPIDTPGALDLIVRLQRVSLTPAKKPMTSTAESSTADSTEESPITPECLANIRRNSALRNILRLLSVKGGPEPDGGWGPEEKEEEKGWGSGGTGNGWDNADSCGCWGAGDSSNGWDNDSHNSRAKVPRRGGKSWNTAGKRRELTPLDRWPKVVSQIRLFQCADILTNICFTA